MRRSGDQASGSCAAADLEAALQLLHLLFVAELRWDEGRLETVLSYVEEHVRNQNKDPQERLMGMINQVNTQVGSGGGSGGGAVEVACSVAYRTWKPHVIDLGCNCAVVCFMATSTMRPAWHCRRRSIP